MGPAFPGAASETEDSLEHRDATFDPGPKASQLSVDPTGPRHILNLQPPFLGEGDVSDALVLRPLQVGLGGEALIEAGLSRPAAVKVLLTLEPGLELSGIVEVPPRDPKIQNQSRDAPGEVQLVSEDRLPPFLLDDIGVLLKYRDHLFLGRNRLPVENSTLGLIDDPHHQVQGMAQFPGPGLAVRILPPVSMPQCHPGVMSGLASDLQQIPVRSLATLAAVVSDVHTTPLGAEPVIAEDDLVLPGQPEKGLSEDPNCVGQQLGIGRIGDVTFHCVGIGSNLATTLQSLAVRPIDQEPVDLSPGRGLDAADVLLETGGTGKPVLGEAGEATETLGVAQEKRQLAVGQLRPVLKKGRAQNLLYGEPRSPLAGTASVTQIV